MDRIEMSKKEIKRLEELRQLADGVVSQREAGWVLGVSEHQVLGDHDRGNVEARSDLGLGQSVAGVPQEGQEHATVVQQPLGQG